MKDAYSFDRDDEGLQASYDTMLQAYRRVFDRCGLTYVIVEADPGTIGGGVNHEFMAHADVGEDLYVACPNGDYLADLEAAMPRPPEPADTTELEPLTEVSTPSAATIDAVSKLLGRPASDMLKCILFDVGGQAVAVLVPGDREVNETKVARRFFPAPVRRFEDADFVSLGLVKGYVGPHGLPDDIMILADHSVRGGKDWVTGANKPEHHVTGANVGRDYRVDEYADLVQIREGDPCPNCGQPLRAVLVDERRLERLAVGRAQLVDVPHHDRPLDAEWLAAVRAGIALPDLHQIGVLVDPVVTSDVGPGHVVLRFVRPRHPVLPPTDRVVGQDHDVVVQAVRPDVSLDQPEGDEVGVLEPTDRGREEPPSHLGLVHLPVAGDEHCHGLPAHVEQDALQHVRCRPAQQLRDGVDRRRRGRRDLCERLELRGVGGLGRAGHCRLQVGQVVAVRTRDVQILPHIGVGHELVVHATADRAWVRLHDHVREPAPVEHAPVGLEHRVVGRLQPFIVPVERVGVLHQELPDP